MNTTRTMRKPCFKGGEDDAGFASIPTNNNNNNNNNNVTYIINRRNSLRHITTCSTTTTTLVYSPRSSFTPLHSPSPHFLESCSLCRKPLGGNRDIFMYRGDTPFCSEECRQEQIEIDESKEKSWGMKKMMRSKNESRSSKGQDYPLRKSTVAAA